jgi:hypothetical protein
MDTVLVADAAELRFALLAHRRLAPVHWVVAERPETRMSCRRPEHEAGAPMGRRRRSTPRTAFAPGQQGKLAPKVSRGRAWSASLLARLRVDQETSWS